MGGRGTKRQQSRYHVTIGHYLYPAENYNVNREAQNYNNKRFDNKNVTTINV